MMRRIGLIVTVVLAVAIVLTGCAGRHGPMSTPEGLTALKTSQTTPEELNTPAAVSAQERMKAYSFPGEYVAFSLTVAQQMIAGIDAGRNYRTVYPEVYNLGGINQIAGLVYDRQAKELILVGKYDPDRQPLTLDEFRFIAGHRSALLKADADHCCLEAALCAIPYPRSTTRAPRSRGACTMTMTATRSPACRCSTSWRVARPRPAKTSPA
jgi:hypothetical protein